MKRYNGTKLRELGTSVLKVEARHSSASARKASVELTQGLHCDVFLAQGVRVMLTRNLWLEVGMVNGIRGDVVDIVLAQGQKAPALPDFVVLPLEGYKGPVLSSDPRYRGCVGTLRDVLKSHGRQQQPGGASSSTPSPYAGR